MIDGKSYQSLEDTNQKNILDNTFYYLERYLNPDKKWDVRTTPKQRINQIRYANVNWETVADHIKEMSYQNFLKTPYWKAIASHTKYRAGYRCQLCNSTYNLMTHHRDYSIHGFEHAHMHELTVLCDDCHNKFHDSRWNTQFTTTRCDNCHRKLHDSEEKAQYTLWESTKWERRVIKIIVTISSVFFVYFLIQDTDMFFEFSSIFEKLKPLFLIPVIAPNPHSIAVDEWQLFYLLVKGMFLHS